MIKEDGKGDRVDRVRESCINVAPNFQENQTHRYSPFAIRPQRPMAAIHVVAIYRQIDNCWKNTETHFQALDVLSSAVRCGPALCPRPTKAKVTNRFRTINSLYVFLFFFPFLDILSLSLTLLSSLYFCLLIICFLFLYISNKYYVLIIYSNKKIIHLGKREIC